jgi:hypothetical protein
MVGESAERTLELSLASDEEPVEALHAERAEFPSPEPAYTPRDPFRCFRRRRQSAGFAGAESRPDTATGNDADRPVFEPLPCTLQREPGSFVVAAEPNRDRTGNLVIAARVLVTRPRACSSRIAV